MERPIQAATGTRCCEFVCGVKWFHSVVNRHELDCAVSKPSCVVYMASRFRTGLQEETVIRIVYSGRFHATVYSLIGGIHLTAAIRLPRTDRIFGRSYLFAKALVTWDSEPVNTTSRVPGHSVVSRITTDCLTKIYDVGCSVDCSDITCTVVSAVIGSR